MDAIAPPDFILNSALEHSDGKAYDHLEEEFRSRTGKTEWWKDLSGFLKDRNETSKI